MSWNNEDPRSHASDCNRNYLFIIICRKNGISSGSMIGTGEVYIENGWNISTDFDDYKWLDVDFKWPEDWFWIEIPR